MRFQGPHAQNEAVRQAIALPDGVEHPAIVQLHEGEPRREVDHGDLFRGNAQGLHDLPLGELGDRDDMARPSQ